MRRAQSNSSSQLVRNLAYNPSFEASSISSILRTNIVQNPSCETTGSATVTRTNLFTNPSAETTTAGTVNVRTNLATNPGFETASGTTTVRTNLATNPSFEAASGVVSVQANLLLNPLGRVSNAQVDVGPNVSVVYDTAGAVITHTNAAAPGNAFFGVKCTLVSGNTYYARAVLEDVTGTFAANISAHGNIGSPMGSVTTGTREGSQTTREWSFVSTLTGTCRLLIDMTGTGAGESFRLKEMIISEQPLGTYFDGSTPIVNPVTNPDLSADLTNWISNGTLTRVFENGRWWANVPAGKYGYAAVPTVVGQWYAASVRVRGTPGTTGISIISTDNVVGGFLSATSYTMPASGEMVITASSVPATPAGTGSYVGVNAPAGSDLKITEVYLEKVSGVGQFPKNHYFKGQGDFTYVWSGTANASTSYQQAPAVVSTTAGGVGGSNSAAFQATSWKSTGSKALRIRALTSSGDSYTPVGGDTGAIRLGMVPGKTYTFSATAYVPGGAAAQNSREIRAYYRNPASGAGYVTFTSAQTALDASNTRRASVTMTLPADATEAFVRLYNGHSATTGLGDVWWDDFLVEETTVALPYFDGGTAAAGDFTYGWAGTANASTSTQTAPTVATISSYWAANELKMYQSSSAAMRGSKGMRFQAIRPSTFLYGTGGANGTAVTVGETATVSFYVRSSVTRNFRAGIVYNDANPATYGSWTSCAANVWTRVSHTGTVPAGSATTMTAYFNSETMSSVGDIYDIDCFLIEKTAIVGEYFDASMPIENLHANPSFDTNTTGWNMGGVGSRDTTKAYTGVASLKVDTSSAASYSGISTTPALVVGQTYTWSAYIWAPTGTSVNFAADCLAVNTAVPGNNAWQRVSLTGTCVNGNNLWVRSTAANQAAFWVDAVLLERATTASPYFEGTGDFAYVWAGTANASVSHQQAPGVSFFGFSNASSISSTDWSESGTKSVRIIPNNSNNDTFASLNGVTLATGKTYTVSATIRMTGAQTGTLHSAARQIRVYHSGTSSISTTAPNAAGSTRLSTSFTVTDGSVYQSIRLGNGASIGGGDVWWDDIVIEEGTTNGSYFDGSNPIQNLVSNSSFETDTTGWAADTGAPTLSADSTFSWIGAKALKMVSTTASADIAVRTGLTVAPNTVYTLSWYVYSPNARTAYFDVSGSPTFSIPGQGNKAIPANTWTRVSGTFRTPSALNGPVTFFLHHGGGPATIGTILYIDAVLLEKSPVLGPYYAGLGDFTYGWSGTANASTSEQRAFNVSDRISIADNVAIYQSGIRSVTGAKAGAFRTRKDVLTEGTLIYPAVDYFTDGTGTRLVPNAVHTWSMYVWVPSGSGTVRLQDLTSGVIGSPNTLFDQWERISVTFTAAASGAHILRLRAHTTVPAGTTMWWDNELLEVSSLAQPYFDGATTATSDFTYTWAGAANASVSRMNANLIQSVTGTAYAVQSSEWSSSGSKSMRIAVLGGSTTDTYIAVGGDVGGLRLGMEPGKTYTAMAKCRLSGPISTSYQSPRVRAITAFTRVGSGAYSESYSAQAPNIVGVTPLSVTFTVPSNATEAAIRLYNGSGPSAGDVWWDDFMVVEGRYTGDYVDGTKPFSKWTGSANASVSVGYPPQLLDLAGTPVYDVSSAGNFVLPGGFGDQEARTIYTVYQNILPVNGNGPVGLVMYGSNDLSDTVPNTNMTLRQQTYSSSMNALISRRTGGAGVIISPQGIGSHVACWGITSAGYMYIQTDNSASRPVDSVVMSLPHQRINITNNTWGTHVRTIIYRGEHDVTIRAAVSRYLGNKYGANVA